MMTSVTMTVIISSRVENLRNPIWNAVSGERRAALCAIAPKRVRLPVAMTTPKPYPPPTVVPI